jgi:hypothetical protein
MPFFSFYQLILHFLLQQQHDCKSFVFNFQEYPDYIAYTTPTFFVDDWLNMYLDSHPIHRDSDIANHKNEVNCSDYRFVYMGAKGMFCFTMFLLPLCLHV